MILVAVEAGELLPIKPILEKVEIVQLFETHCVTMWRSGEKRRIRGD